ncbi:MAG TPA: YegS/Rv2252/BmrU family lipid kinase, partial [Candidatus Baltobacteraceae bacterium]|nr:YegS/Rv2252/BmrU family lipid kinase [Candidatus Baltobacteraceae bacterium]
MRALLVLNEHSRLGQRDGDLVCRTLAELGIDCERDLKAQDIDAVIAAGGDGTVIRTIPVAIERGVPLGIVPLGTFNDLARTLNIPLDPRAACQCILAGRTRKIDAGRVNGVYFVNEASVGLSTRIARKQTPEVKQRLGFLAVIATTIQSLRETRPFRVRLEYDGKSESFASVQLTIANNSHFGGIFHREDAAIDDGWLDLYSVEVRGWTQAVGVVRNMIRGIPAASQGLRTRRATAFTVDTGQPHHIAADGEPAG